MFPGGGRVPAGLSGTAIALKKSPGGAVASLNAPSAAVTGTTGSSTTFFQTVQTVAANTGHVIGTFFANLYATVKDFFTSGRALQTLQTTVQATNDFAIRIFSPLATVLLPLLQRIAPGTTATTEVVAVWIFWVLVALVLLILILIPHSHRRNKRIPLPRVSRKTTQEPENNIEFSVVEPGPQPSVSEHVIETDAQPSAAALSGLLTEKRPRTAASEQTPDVHAGAASIPEISLKPLGYYTPAESDNAFYEKPVPAQPAATKTAARSVNSLDDALLKQPAEADVPPVAEAPAEAVTSAEERPALHPMGEESTAPMSGETVPETPLPDIEPLGVSNTSQAEAEPREPAAEPQKAPVEPQKPSPATKSEPPQYEEERHSSPPAPAAILSQLLEEETALQNLRTKTQEPLSEPVPAAAASGPAAPASIFSGDVDLDSLLHGGVVVDAAALTQLFRGGYRGTISKLAISAKNLQDVPEEIRHVLKLTVVALSPIELSIAHDLAMRLEAPGFVGEALLVAKKMGYETYLTTYANITHNYKEVHIAETSSLRAPVASTGSSQDLISLN